MMKREDMEEVVIDYLYDELPDAERASFEASLPSYPDLSDEIRDTTSLREALRSIQPEPVPSALTQRILRIAEEEIGQRAGTETGLFQKFINLLMQPAFATALVFIVVGSTTILLNQNDTPISPTEFEASNSSGSQQAANSPTSRHSVASQAAPARAERGEALALAADSGPIKEKHPKTVVPAPAKEEAVAKNSAAARAPLIHPKGAPRAAKTKNAPLKRPVDIRLAESKNSLYARQQRKRKTRSPSGKETGDVASVLLAAAETKPRAAKSPPQAIAFGEQAQAPTPLPKTAGSKKGEKVAKKAKRDKSDARLIKAFERALKKRQFGEARKLLGLMERRPALKQFAKSKRSLLPKKKKAPGSSKR